MYDLELVLEEPDRVYFSGDILRGHVLVNISDSLAVQAVIVRFVGEAGVSVPEQLAAEKYSKRKTASNKIRPAEGSQGGDGAQPCWLEVPPTPHKSKKSSKNPSLSKFAAHEKYFFHKEYLYGHKYSSYREKLTGGNHEFGFKFCLPGGLPPSFNGRFGYIRYYCECTLLRWKQNDSRRVYFSVSNVADINNEAKAESGCEEQRSTNSCLFCCPRGTIIASAELKRRGYAPGELAPLTVDIHNMSSSTITSTKAVIIQVVCYSTTGGQRRAEDERRVLEETWPQVGPGASVSWPPSGISIPPLPPSSFTPDSCKIIAIQYRIDVMMFISGEKEALVLKLPLIIGNIPLKKHFPLLAGADQVSAQAPLPKHLYHRYSSLPGVWSAESVNPAQSDCVYKLPEFCPRYLVYKPRSQT